MADATGSDLLPEVRHALGRCIQDWRQRRGLTQDRLAKLVGMAPSMVSHYEAGDGNPTVRNLLLFVRALEVESLDDFFRPLGSAAYAEVLWYADRDERERRLAPPGAP